MSAASTPDGTLSTHEKLIYMANQIARNFGSLGEDAAIAATADHIAKFWDPRMRQLIVAHFHAGGAGLDSVARAAVERLAAGVRAA